jgi:hypothetical protein
VRVVVFLAENFPGWEIGSAGDDARFGIQYRNDNKEIQEIRKEEIKS